MPRRPRVLAVDALRGATIALMILVNNPGSWGSIYAPLRHAPWHGCTPTDLVFPFFLFVVGVAIALALGPRGPADSRGPGDAKRAPVIGKILKRSALLFAVGLFLNVFPVVRDFLDWEWKDWSRLRIPGVLQRIALCYLAAALLYVRAPPAVWSALIPVLLVGYWALMTQVPLPDGGGAGLDDKTHNLAAYLDRQILGAHVWRSAGTWDPEGVLSTLPAIATTLIGVAAGCVLRSGAPVLRQAVILALVGVVVAAAGYGVDAAGWMPINKPLWTSSYVLFTGGCALLALAVCMVGIDVLGGRRWAFPFLVYGKNALTVFVLSALVGRLLSAVRWRDDGNIVTLKAAIYEAGFTSWIGNPELASLAYALTNVLAFFVLLLWMHRRDIVIRL